MNFRLFAFWSCGRKSTMIADSFFDRNHLSLRQARKINYSMFYLINRATGHGSIKPNDAEHYTGSTCGCLGAANIAYRIKNVLRLTFSR